MRVIVLTVFLALVGAKAYGWERSKNINRTELGDFQLQWMNNESDPNVNYKTADHPNGIFIIEAYYRACYYCNQNAPAVNDLAGEYAANARVQVLDVSRDCRAGDYASWIETHSPNHPVLNDCKMQVLGPLGARAYPTTYVLDCNKNVVWSHMGTWDAATNKALRAKINELLKTECVAQ